MPSSGPVKKRLPSAKKRFQADAEETAHYNAILIEDLRDQFRFVTEKVGSMEEPLKSHMDENKGELKREIENTRDALSMRIDRVEVGLRQEITETRKDLSSRIDKVGTGFSSLKQDIAKCP